MADGTEIYGRDEEVVGVLREHFKIIDDVRRLKEVERRIVLEERASWLIHSASGTGGFARFIGRAKDETTGAYVLSLPENGCFTADHCKKRHDKDGNASTKQLSRPELGRGMIVAVEDDV